MSTKADAIRTLKAEGASNADICRLLGIKGKDQVRRALKRHNPGKHPEPDARPGWPKTKMCLGFCGKMRTATWEGDRRCDACKADYDCNSLLPDAELHGA